MTDAKHVGVSMALAEAVLDVIDILRGRPGSGGGGPDRWERVVAIIAEHDSLPDGEVKVIEELKKAGAKRPRRQKATK